MALDIEQLLQGITKVEPKTNTMLSFNNCPYNCNNGVVLDAIRKSKDDCPYCKEVRKRLLNGSLKLQEGLTLQEKLQLTKPVIGYNTFDMKMVIREKDRVFIDSESLTDVENKMQELLDYVNAKRPLEYSVLFNCGKKVHELDYLSMLIAKAYENGFSVSPLLFDDDLIDLRNADLKGTLDSKQQYLKSVIYTSDICVVDILASATKDHVMLVDALLTKRARNGKATIVLTNSWIKQVQEMGCYDDYYSLEEPRFYSIKYAAPQQGQMDNVKVYTKPQPVENLYTNSYNNNYSKNSASVKTRPKKTESVKEVSLGQLNIAESQFIELLADNTCL